MHELNITLVAIGSMVLVLGLLSRSLKQTPLTAPLLALVFGVVLGPMGSGLLHPREWGEWETFLEKSALLTVAIGLMGVSLRLPPDFMQQNRRSLAVLLLLVMPLMWLCSSLLAYWILGLPLLAGLLLGAVVSPTDPIVTTSVVTGEVAEENVREDLRHTLSAESGANDGLAYPLVLLPILLLTRPAVEVWGDWLVRVVLWEVGGAILSGLLLGLVAGHVLHRAEKHKTIDQHSFLAFTLALTLLVVGAAELLHLNSIIAVFAAGIALDQVESPSERRQEERVQEAVNQFFTLPIFTLLGMLLPWEAWREWGWRGLLLVAATLILRRLPFVLLAQRWIPQLRGTKDALFYGWFGPVGAAALFYAMFAMRHTDNETTWTLGSLIICASLVAHGLTAAPLTKLYGRYANR